MFDPLDLYTPDDIQVEALQFNLAEREPKDPCSPQRDEILTAVDEEQSDDDDTIIDNLDPALREVCSARSYPLYTNTSEAR